MHTFTLFNLNSTTMKSLLEITDAVIAGSAALYEYMIESNKNLEWEPNDIDIWIKKTDKIDLYKPIYETIICSFGYEMIESNMYMMRNYKDLKVDNIISFHKKDNFKKIQLIIHNYENTEEILKSFDISCCAIAWSPTKNLMTLPNALADINKMEANIMQDYTELLDKTNNERAISRINKYKKRGFKVYQTVKKEL